MKKAFLVGILAAAFLAYWGIRSVSAQEGDKPRQPKELNEDQVTELLNWMREFEPAGLEKLDRMKKEDPESFKRSLSELYMKMTERKHEQKPDGENGERPHDKQPMKKELNETETAEVTAWLKENDPARAAKSEDIKTKSPKDYARFLSECYMQMQRDKEMAEKNPEEYQRMAKTRKLESECFQLAEQYRSAKDEAAKKGLKDQMTQKLNDLFDVREAERAQKAKAREEELTRELARLKEELQTRQANKQKIVEKRLQEMTGEQGDLGW